MNKIAMFLGSLLFSLSWTSSALATFNTEKERSINYTGDTLPAGGGEMGFYTLSYGVTDNFMVTVPTLPLCAGVYGAGLRYKFNIGENFRISPEIKGLVVDKTLLQSSALSFGYDSPSKKHSFTLSADYVSILNLKFKDIELPKFIPSFNYDYYTHGGNLFFVTVFSPPFREIKDRNTALLAAPMLGYTWAWENFHLGLIQHTGFFFMKFSSKTVIPPLPFFYWRF